MKYITRELYQSMQGGDAATRPAREAAWDQVWADYRARLEQTRSRLPSNMQAFAELTFHDGVVRAINHENPATIRLEIDAINNPWGPRGIYQITFKNVREVSDTSCLLGDAWLYEEVHLHPHGFDYRVLFWHAEFQVVASDVEWTQLNPDKAAPCD